MEFLPSVARKSTCWSAAIKLALPYLNISAYKFCRLGGLESLRAQLKERCRELDLKGTIVLSTEGINVNVAGVDDRVEGLRRELAADPRFADLEYKESRSNERPFSRMLVRVKNEIVPLGDTQVDPSEKTAPRLSPQQLKEWLDEGRDFTLLDTRNDYEVRIGTFKQASHLSIQTFREFPSAVEGRVPNDDEKPLVMFCTGGIRCEKASAVLLERGFRQVYQLDGGILGYFKQCGAAHYEGECFVYDQRVALDESLDETATIQCFSCGQPLTPEEQREESYVPDVSCPYCIGGKVNGRPRRNTKSDAL